MSHDNSYSLREINVSSIVKWLKILDIVFIVIGLLYLNLVVGLYRAMNRMIEFSFPNPSVLDYLVEPYLIEGIKYSVIDLEKIGLSQLQAIRIGESFLIFLQYISIPSFYTLKGVEKYENKVSVFLYSWINYLKILLILYLLFVPSRFVIISVIGMASILLHSIFNIFYVPVELMISGEMESIIPKETLYNMILLNILYISITMVVLIILYKFANGEWKIREGLREKTQVIKKKFNLSERRKLDNMTKENIIEKTHVSNHFFSKKEQRYNSLEEEYLNAQ